MQDLTVIGVENGALIVSSHDGTRFHLPVNEALHARIRQATPVSGAARKIAPREIQAQIRSGMSAEDVAAVTGVPVDYVRKFEGPVLAEREFVIESALNVAVRTAIETDTTSQGSTFGSVIRGRLHDLGATGERWASWKETDGGWVVKLAFTADQIDHDARWGYEPKRAALSPLNNEANTLSQQGEMPGGLIPRLRAVNGDERALDSSRFDSGAFDVRGESRGGDSVAQLEAVQFVRSPSSSPEVSAAAINRAPVDAATSSQTSDLLDALRRRRGERESASWDIDEATVLHPATGNFRLVELPVDRPGDASAASGADEVDEATRISPQQTAPQPFAPQVDRQAATSPFAPKSFTAQSFTAQSFTAQSNTAQAGGQNPAAHGQQEPSQPSATSHPAKATGRKARASMPSWDEIVFGARSDDD